MRYKYNVEASPQLSRTSGIQVIDRAAEILRALSGERNGLSLSEIAARVHLPRSTIHRIVVALEVHRLVTAASPAGRYRLGPELIRLAGTAHGELRAEIRPMLDMLSAQVNETVDLAVMTRDEVTFIDQVAAPRRLRAVSAVGVSFPAYCTANGKALLAALPDAYVRKMLPARLKPFTERTITRRDALLAELAEVRENGYAVDREEHTLGISAVGAAVHDPFGAVAAVTIPLPTQRFTGRQAELADALLSTTQRISEVLSGGVEITPVDTA